MWLVKKVHLRLVRQLTKEREPKMFLLIVKVPAISKNNNNLEVLIYQL